QSSEAQWVCDEAKLDEREEVTEPSAHVRQTGTAKKHAEPDVPNLLDLERRVDSKRGERLIYCLDQRSSAHLGGEEGSFDRWRGSEVNEVFLTTVEQLRCEFS